MKNIHVHIYTQTLMRGALIVVLSYEGEASPLSSAKVDLGVMWTLVTLRLKIPPENVKIITDVHLPPQPEHHFSWTSCPRISYDTTALELITSINELVTSCSFSFILMSGHGEVCQLRKMSFFSIGRRMVSGAALTAPINPSSFCVRVEMKRGGGSHRGRLGGEIREEGGLPPALHEAFSAPVRDEDTSSSVITFRDPTSSIQPTISKDIFFFVDCCYSAGIIKLPYACSVDRHERLVRLSTGISRSDLGDIRLAVLSSCHHNELSFSSPRGSPMISNLCALIGCCENLQEVVDQLPRGSVLTFMRESDLQDMRFGEQCEREEGEE